MALSEKWVLEKARALLWNPDYTGFNPVAFTRAIEAEIRKQLERPAPCQHQCEAQAFRIDKRSDTRLIRILVEALEYHRAQTRPIELTDEAITAGRARLVEGGQ